MAYEKFIFNEGPTVKFVSNTFINVPVILQFDDTPITSIEKDLTIPHSVSIPIHGPDGAYLAKYKASRLFLTEDGKKADLKLEHPQDMDVCTLDGKPLFELKRIAAAAINLEVELYTPTGYFIKCSGEKALIDLLDFQKESLKVGNITMSNNTISGGDIGVWIKSDGSISLNYKRPENKKA